MELGIGPHLEEAELEQYSMGTLPEQRINSFEEHFLACEICQDQLLEMEAYVNAVRSVSPKLRKARGLRSKVLSGPILSRTFFAVAAIVTIIVGTRLLTRAPSSRAELAVVLLQANRGIEGLITAKAAQPLSLRMDLRELPGSSSYRVEIVGADGTAIQNSTVTPQNGAITQDLKDGLRAGSYFVRLYTATGELLREYGLQVR